ncbi:hypothetical protein CFP56_025697 [Quercus suber]|uniref:Uncharacterized protein n=1 Tax=Quercus suber TaxID=58331 RepID=A0AAW0K1V9_QUESU
MDRCGCGFGFDVDRRAGFAGSVRRGLRSPSGIDTSKALLEEIRKERKTENQNHLLERALVSIDWSQACTNVIFPCNYILVGNSVFQKLYCDYVDLYRNDTLSTMMTMKI